MQLKRMALRKLIPLPQEVIAEILSWLPAKSLLRFKCLSTQWLSLISSPYFNAKRILHSTSVPPLLVLLSITCYPRTVWLREETGFLESFHTPFPFSNEAEIVGSCHGLICFSLSPSGTELVIWNPATRQVRFIPPPSVPLQDRNQIVRSAFGFDRSLTDFMVMRILCVQVEGTCTGVFLRVEVFYRSRGLWREIGVQDSIELTNLVLQMHCPPVAHRGVIYWSVKEENEPLLLSFDIEKESFGKISLPRPPGRNYSWKIFVWRGSLVVFHPQTYGIRSSLDIWGMSDTAGTITSHSWTKLKTIQGLPVAVRCLAIWKDCEILMNTCGGWDPCSLILHNLDTGEVKCVWTGCQYPFVLQAYNNCETLLPVN